MTCVCEFCEINTSRSGGVFAESDLGIVFVCDDCLTEALIVYGACRSSGVVEDIVEGVR